MYVFVYCMYICFVCVCERERERERVCVPLVEPDSVGHQAFLPMGFSRHEYWSGLPFPSTEHLSDPGIEASCPVSPGDVSKQILYHSATWLSLKTNYQNTSTFITIFFIVFFFHFFLLVGG